MSDLWKRYAQGMGSNRDRIVLHSDLNNFFASVECKRNPELYGKPVAVCGSREDRHGIVLAKNEIAKKEGVKTAEAIWQAQQKCPGLVIVPPNYDEYERHSALVKKIYCDYSDMIEDFGIDESWIELTGDVHIKNLCDGKRIAEEIRKRIKKEIGLTVSVGVSDNKVFAKMASDYKKPDAVTVLGPENYIDTIRNIEIGDMLFVGRSTREKLHVYGVNTIGDMADREEVFFKSMLGKNGVGLFYDACGENKSPVAKIGEHGEVKSVGNSVTLHRNLENAEDVYKVFCILADKVAFRLRKGGFKCNTVAISVRSTGLVTTERQGKIERTSNAIDIAKAAYKLYTDNYDKNKPVRSVGIRTTELVSRNENLQICLFDNSLERKERWETLDDTTDKIRLKYGMGAIRLATAGRFI